MADAVDVALAVAEGEAVEVILAVIVGEGVNNTTAQSVSYTHLTLPTIYSV